MSLLVGEIIQRLRKLDDGQSRPVSMIEREVCGEAADMIAAIAGTLRSFIEAFDNGAVQLSSSEIQVDDDHPPHPWHEEWISHARAIAATSNVSDMTKDRT